MPLGSECWVLRRQSADVQMQPDFVDGLRRMPIALSTAEANEQHYEVETQFFDIALGKRLARHCMGLTIR